MLNPEITFRSITTMLDKVLFEWSKNSLHTAMPGVVDSYDATTRRARVRPALRLVMTGARPGEDGEMMERALAVNVPVMWSSSGGFAGMMPLNPGDRGMLLFSERGMTEFKTTGTIATPDKSRFFSESDGVFYPCDFGIEAATPASATAAVIQTLDGTRSMLVDTDRVELRAGDTRVTATESDIRLVCSGTLEIDAGAVQVQGRVDVQSGLDVSGGAVVQGGLQEGGKNVGATHMHTGVLTGPGITGPPV